MSETTTSLAIRDKSEACALAWLTFRKPVDLVWDPVEFKRRKEQTNRKYPRVVFDAARAPEDEAVDALYRVELGIYLGTSADEVVTGSTPQVAHTQRSGWIAESFGYGYKKAFVHFCTLSLTDFVSAPDIAAGMIYEIVTIGTTDFTAIGAAANTVGTIFTATATGQGTGTVKRGNPVPVPGIAVYDLFVEEEIGEQTERNWFDQFTYSVVAALRDE
ncbi:MAG: hypothetical protein K0R17_1014 [Rariglobus sp.]|jgi:hypothetical protein|nr:hypothetical protein [Rariglobus sp.]